MDAQYDESTSYRPFLAADGIRKVRISHTKVLYEVS